MGLFHMAIVTTGNQTKPKVHGYSYMKVKPVKPESGLMLIFSFSSHAVNWDKDKTLPELQDLVTDLFNNRLHIKDGGSPQV